jgi:hypothetical protein
MLLAVGTHIVAETLVAEVPASRRFVLVALFGLGPGIVGVEKSGFGFTG